MTGATMTLSDCARALGAQLHAKNINAMFAGVSTDSRSIAPNELFVALKGPTFDGHEYVEQVRQRGAAAALVSRLMPTDLPQIVVGDTMLGYGALAQNWRSRFNLPVIALTGSNGKTTVKEMLRAVMVKHVGSADQVLATEGNLNNNIGLPQMLLRLGNHHRAAVLEMGMNHLYEIDYLTRLAVPDVALIIMAGTAHIGELGSRQAIAQAKGEIYAGLREDGIACLNIDDKYADYWRSLIGEKRRIVTFGTVAPADVRGELRGELTGASLTLHAAGQKVDIRLQVMGEHNQRNAIAAAAGAYALGVPLPTIAEGLTQFSGVDGRLRSYVGHNSATIIDDTYNANPDSMRAAISVLARRPGKRLLVLGDMGELGVDAAAMHAEIGKEAKAARVDGLFALGELARVYAASFGAGAVHAANVEELLAALKPTLDANTTLLIKGSRFMRMERVVHALVDSAQIKPAKGIH
jgi:UDP-N-acetylmuramoyl-tripeptide--D-alanyl-D-alanine ligase